VPTLIRSGAAIAPRSAVLSIQEDKQMALRRTAVVIAGFGLALALGPDANGQYAGKPAETPARMAGEASLSAKLVDPAEKAKKQAATVQVVVKGVRIVDPALSGEKPIKGQGHLHYQVDDGPVIATTAPKLSFHGLKPGTHTVTVALAANDHSPLGPQEKLSVLIP
jgi:hypothetical protein